MHRKPLHLTARVSVMTVATTVAVLSGASADAHNGTCTTTPSIPEVVSGRIRASAEYRCQNPHFLTLKVCLQKQTSPGIFQDVQCGPTTTTGSQVYFTVHTIFRDCPIEGTQWRTWARGQVGDGSNHIDTAISPDRFRDC